MTDAPVPRSSSGTNGLPDWGDPRVQIVYDMLCDDALNMPPNPEEHWEGWISRNIVAALCGGVAQPPTNRELHDAIAEAISNGRTYSGIQDAVRAIQKLYASSVPSTNSATPEPDPAYRDVVRKWFELRMSQQRDIAFSLNLPAQGYAKAIDWGKLVLTTAKERGELARIASEIDAALSSTPRATGAD